MSRLAILVFSVLLIPTGLSHAEEAADQSREPSSVETEDPIIIDMGDRTPDSVPAAPSKAGSED